MSDAYGDKCSKYIQLPKTRGGLLLSFVLFVLMLKIISIKTTLYKPVCFVSPRLDYV